MICECYDDLLFVVIVNNFVIVVWVFLFNFGDFSVVIGDVVVVGFDMDCNGVIVGGLWGL